MFKGIILAGGAGTRLYPITKAYSKQLVNIYDKPMIYYPLSTLMMMGIHDILIISDEYTIPMYKKMLNNGNNIGINIEYKIQVSPKGIAESFIIGKDFIGQDGAVLILGDNLFYGEMNVFIDSIKNHKTATIFGYRVDNPQEYGVVELDSDDNPISIQEKPQQPKSNYAIPGLYIYDNSVIEIAQNLTPSSRGELEITDINKIYLSQQKLQFVKIGRGIAWLDTGSPQSLLEASNFIAAIENRQGFKIACIEEIALRKQYITKEEFDIHINNMPNSQYKTYLKEL